MFSPNGLFLEMPPITLENYTSMSFEITLVPYPEFSNLQPNYSPFKEKFDFSCDSSGVRKSVVTFLNLAGDSLLIVPCPVFDEGGKPRDFGHLMKFVQLAEPRLMLELWRRVAEEVVQWLTAHPGQRLWVSTSGLGVSWLHLRLDTRPKYYHYLPYKM
jgi:hypothetical protein